MDNKLKISGLGSMVLVGQEKIEPEKEYLISIRAELKKIEKDIEDKDEPSDPNLNPFLHLEFIPRGSIIEINKLK